MSGIVGIFNRDGTPIDGRLLDRMTAFLAFRGPDAQETWSGNEAGFGHTLLRTTWESANEKQPCTLDGQVWITADVRVDGREDLIRQLQAAGREPSQDATDPELVLHAYHAWDQQCLDHLLGDFAFAIWDGRTRRLFCARDHFGIRQFYYSLAGGKFLFSNTLQCIRQSSDVSGKLNDSAIADFLIHGNNQNSATTAFRDIQRLPPGHFLICSRDHFHVAPYWTLPIESPLRYRRADEYVEHFQSLLQAAVGDRLRTDRVGVFMSGGLDSSGLAAVAREILAARSSPSDLRAYTAVYDRLIPDDERHYAGLVAETLKIPIHFLPADDYGIFERWEQPELRRPEPVNNPRGLPIILDQLTKVSAHSRVVFFGEGPDNAMYYEWQAYVLHLLKTLQWGSLLRDVGRHFQCHRGVPLWRGLGNRFRQSKSLRATRTAPADQVRLDWVGPEIRNLATIDPVRNGKAQIIHPFHPVAHKGLSGPLWNTLFEGFDAGCTHSTVEVWHPYMDVRLIRFLLAVPLIPWCREKYLLRRVFQSKLPKAVLRRRKTALQGEPLLECAKAAGLPQWIPEPEIFRYVDPDAVNAALKQYQNDPWGVLRPLSLNFFLAFERLNAGEYGEGKTTHDVTTGPVEEAL